MNRFLVTPDRTGDGSGWEFQSYRCWVLDAEDARAAGPAYVAAVERMAAEVNERYPKVVHDPWDGEGRPSEVGVAPMRPIGGFSTITGPDRKHLAEAFQALFDYDAAQAVPTALPP